MKSKLSPKQEAFCLAYIKSGNATQAYREAGYKTRSDNSAAVCSAKMLRNAKVQSRIDELTAEISNAEIMEALEIQKLFTKIARGETTDTYVLQNGKTLEKPATLTVRIKAAETLA